MNLNLTIFSNEIQKVIINKYIAICKSCEESRILLPEDIIRNDSRCSVFVNFMAQF